MGKKNKSTRRKKSGKWIPPKGSSVYFSVASDYEFKERHPVGYAFLVLLGIVALMLPVVLYLFFVLSHKINSPWLMLGWVGSFIIGVGLFNYVAIIIKQHLGHIVSILSFLIGGMLVLISLVQMGIL